MDIAGHAAIVTGGGTGLGAAVAELLSAEGARVAVLGRRAEVAEEEAERIGGLGLACDIADAASTESAFATARERHGPARILINCAGVGAFGPVVGPDGAPMPLDDFRRVIEINLIGTFNAIRLAAADMSGLEPLDDGERGVIINTSSVAGRDGSQMSIPYAVSKGGVDALTLPLAREFGRHGIRVVTICPGPFKTPMTDRAPPALLARVAESLVFPKRRGRPEEFARLALHICQNSFINGAIYRIDSGLRAGFMAPEDRA